VLIGLQALSGLASIRSGCGDAGNRSVAVAEPRDRNPHQGLVLFDSIVGSLASDHNVVDVRLAQPGAADPYEARLL